MNAINDIVDNNADAAANDDADGGINIGGINVQQLFGDMPQPQPPAQQTLTWPSYHRGGALGIISERHFARNVAEILAEKNVPEVTMDRLESGLDADRVAALCNLFADRHWKSVTLSETQPQTQNQELWSELINAAIQKTKRLEIRGGTYFGSMHVAPVVVVVGMLLESDTTWTLTLGFHGTFSSTRPARCLCVGLGHSIAGSAVRAASSVDMRLQGHYGSGLHLGRGRTKQYDFTRVCSDQIQIATATAA